MSLLLLFNGGDDAQETVEVNRRFSGRHGTEWYTCQRCGQTYPRIKVVVQNGLVVCYGANTLGCYDKPGAGASRIYHPGGYEEPPAPLPETNEDL